MGDFINRPGISPVVDKVAQAFCDNKVHIKRNHKILFVCGGTREDCIREKFLTYAKNNLDNFHIFKAEDTFTDLNEDGEHRFLNLSDIEKLICDVADSVVIFPESEGSYAEVGLFSAIEKIASKTLIANKINYQASNSFLSIGPIYDIQKQSAYGQSAYLTNDENGDISFAVMPKMLKRTKGKKIISLDPNNLDEINEQAIFYTVMLLVYIFPVLRAVEVSKIIKGIFRPIDYKMIKQYLSMLCGANYLHRNGDYYFLQDDGVPFFTIKGWEVEAVRADIMSVYFKEAPEALKIRE